MLRLKLSDPGEAALTVPFVILSWAKGVGIVTKGVNSGISRQLSRNSTQSQTPNRHLKVMQASGLFLLP